MAKSAIAYAVAAVHGDELTSLQFRLWKRKAVDQNADFRSDQTAILTAIESGQSILGLLRRVSYYDADTDKRLQFFTNNCVLTCTYYCADFSVDLADGIRSCHVIVTAG